MIGKMERPRLPELVTSGEEAALKFGRTELLVGPSKQEPN